MKKLTILFCIIFLISCSPISSTVNEQYTPSQSPIITSTSVLSTKTLTPTPEKIPTTKSTATSADIPNKYEFPNWLSDPEATVALMTSDITKDIYKLSFLNLGTRDSFDISISADLARGYFWMPDGTKFGLLSANTQTVFLVDLKSGNVEQSLLTESAVRFLKDERKQSVEPLIVYGTFPSNFSFLPTYHPQYSANLRYVAKLDFQNNEKPIVFIEDLETGKITQISEPPLKELYTYQYLWSPVASLLAILRVHDGMMIPSGDKIEIYKPNGEKVASFEGSFISPRWSPDGSKMLYRETSSISPCIWDINLGTKKCLREIERNHSNANSIGLLDWSKDENQIYYLYYGDNESGLCIYNLINGNDFCPTDGLSELEKSNVERYKISPDNKFFVFHFGDSCAGCDFWGNPTVGIISRDGANFYTIGTEYLVSTPYTFSYPMGTLLWRPKPTFTP